MKIATFNVNGVNKRLQNVLDWLEQSQPDVACLQELKAPDNRFPKSAFAEAGYDSVWCGQPASNGVAILSRIGEPVLTRVELPGDPDDEQARYVEAAVAGVLVASIYAPNGNPRPGLKFDYKLAWNERLIAHAQSILTADVPAVLAGDYNIVPEPHDIYETRSYDNNALVQPEARAAYRRLLEQGWTDSIRQCHPRETIYTFWDYKRNRWQRDAGMRLDHILLSGEPAGCLLAAGVDRQVRGAEGASDHAPVWIELSQQRAAPTLRACNVSTR